MAEPAFLERDIIEVVTGRFKGRDGAIEKLPTASGVFYSVTLWSRKASGRKGWADYVPSAPPVKVDLTAAQMKLLQRGPR